MSTSDGEMWWEMLSSGYYITNTQKGLLLYKEQKTWKEETSGQEVVSENRKGMKEGNRVLTWSQCNI